MYYANLLSIRENEWNPLLHGEQYRLHFHRTHQKELRLDTHRALADYVGEEAGDHSGPPGRRIVLGSSFKGGPRNMQQSYQNLWSLLLDTRSQIIENCARISSNGTFSEKCRVTSWLLSFRNVVFHTATAFDPQADFNPRIGTDVDKFCCGEVPNASGEPELLEAVKNFMVHRRCGVFDPTSPCMKDGRCSKKFPKEMRSCGLRQLSSSSPTRAMDRLYRRLQLQGRMDCSLQSILSNTDLIRNTNLLKYNSNINVGICEMITTVKYFYKYKGTDKARLKIRNDDAADEIKQYLNARYVCPPEAAHRIFGYDLDDSAHSVVRLAMHLQGHQSVMFEQGQEEAALAKAALRDSMLTAYFKLNERSGRISEGSTSTRETLAVDSWQLYYSEIPIHFTFKDKV
uniref:Helitron_like_N domain-containing protein n=1 Tax=Heligmosomoides polygyrus TaxID=6339 RepID=A0A183GVE6_HELPZ